MSDNFYFHFSHAFHVFCFISALSLSIYWIYVFNLNENLCTVEYKKYFTENKNVYPVLSMCFKNPISSTKLENANPRINVSSYIKFLQGQEFDSEMLQIKYSNIIKNLTDYIKEGYVRYRNGTHVSRHPDYKYYETNGRNILHYENKRLFSSRYAFFFEGFYNCYELSIPQDRNIYYHSFRIDNSIFRNGIRSQYALFTILHYPNQLLIANSRKYVWPKERKREDSYIMRFNIRAVELLKRRYTRNRPCNEYWEGHDNEIKQRFIKAINCRPPYLDIGSNVSLCSSKEDLKETFYLRSDDYGIDPPCHEMKKVSVFYEESKLDVKKISWAKKGSFWVIIVFVNEDYKEITQTR